ncbi:hypothetical protein Gotri_014069 [Gossypium trilobum]|uniref:RNase H type-1 domain-containing protein n=1 Tax=Gossypium trilobum TaxID=34281 RepID=A0A7J9DVQ8_9ROSI|nr:hypothetical protein [Gossypium trilobum]
MGKWILGYNRFLGKSSVFIAQLWGILDGLLLLQEQWHDRVLILSDNLEVVKVIYDRNSTRSSIFLVKRIQHNLSQEKRWFVRHIPRKNNQATNILTKMAFANKVELYLFEASPLEIQEILEEDVTRGALSPGSTL